MKMYGASHNDQESFSSMATVFLLKDKTWIERGSGLVLFVFDLKTYALRLVIEPGKPNQYDCKLRPRIRSKGPRAYVVRAQSDIPNEPEHILAVRFEREEDSRAFRQFVEKRDVDNNRNPQGNSSQQQQTRRNSSSNHMQKVSLPKQQLNSLTNNLNNGGRNNNISHQTITAQLNHLGISHNHNQHHNQHHNHNHNQQQQQQRNLNHHNHLYGINNHTHTHTHHNVTNIVNPNINTVNTTALIYQQQNKFNQQQINNNLNNRNNSMQYYWTCSCLQLNDVSTLICPVCGTQRNQQHHQQQYKMTTNQQINNHITHNNHIQHNKYNQQTTTNLYNNNNNINNSSTNTKNQQKNHNKKEEDILLLKLTSANLEKHNALFPPKRRNIKEIIQEQIRYCERYQRQMK